MTDRGLFEPDVLLRDQFSVRSGATVSREKRLMLAVLENALDSFQKYAFALDAQGQQLFHEAVEWLDSENIDWLFSYRNICDNLDINPDYLRTGLDDWRAREERSRAQRDELAAPQAGAPPAGASA